MKEDKHWFGNFHDVFWDYNFFTSFIGIDITNWQMFAYMIVKIAYWHTWTHLISKVFKCIFSLFYVVFIHRSNCDPLILFLYFLSSFLFDSLAWRYRVMSEKVLKDIKNQISASGNKGAQRFASSIDNENTQGEEDWKETNEESPKPRLICLDCDRSFASSSSLNRHKRDVHGLENGSAAKFVCLICDLPFKRNAHLQGHKLRRHLEDSGGVKPFLCEFCRCSFRPLTQKLVKQVPVLVAEEKEKKRWWWWTELMFRLRLRDTIYNGFYRGMKA